MRFIIIRRKTEIKCLKFNSARASGRFEHSISSFSHFKLPPINSLPLRQFLFSCIKVATFPINARAANLQTKNSRKRFSLRFRDAISSILLQLKLLERLGSAAKQINTMIIYEFGHSQTWYVSFYIKNHAWSVAIYN